MKVAILSTGAERGGAERSLLTFLKAAHGRTIEATVLLPKEGPLAGLLSALGVPWQVIPMPMALMSQSRQNLGHTLVMSLKLVFRGTAYLFRLAQGIHRLKPEVIYTNGLKSNLLGAILGPLVRRPVVWHLRDAWGCSLLGMCADLGPHRIIANSRSTAQALKKYMKRPEKVTVIHNAVDLEEFTPEGPVADLGFPGQSEFNVALPGAFASWKGQALLLRTIEPIHRAFPSTGFFFIGGSIYDTVGDRGYEDEIHQLVKQQGLEDHVIFTGFQTEMAPWYRAMDVVVNASIAPEPFGRTLLEAMACGKAVVAPDAGGIPEFVRHGENGLLYEMGNEKALAASLITLLGNPELRRRLGEGGLQTATKFAPEPHAREILSVLTVAKNQNRGINPIASVSLTRRTNL
jgi:glycosyltransferase involved in cell wall biosynthesis